MNIETTPTNIITSNKLDAAREYAARLLDIDASNAVALNCLSPVSIPSRNSYRSTRNRSNNAKAKASTPHIEDGQLEEGYKCLLQEATFLLEEYEIARPPTPTTNTTSQTKAFEEALANLKAISSGRVSTVVATFQPPSATDLAREIAKNPSPSNTQKLLQEDFEGVFDFSGRNPCTKNSHRSPTTRSNSVSSTARPS